MISLKTSACLFIVPYIPETMSIAETKELSLNSIGITCAKAAAMDLHCTSSADDCFRSTKPWKSKRSVYGL
jgi:hypothetical protein